LHEVARLAAHCIAAQPVPLDDDETREYAAAQFGDLAQESGFFDGVKYAEQKHRITAGRPAAVQDGWQLVPVAEVGGGKTFQDLDWIENPPQLENGTVLYAMLAAAPKEGDNNG
jgi:hypothetical protein